jgi:hypothetical protein
MRKGYDMPLSSMPKDCQANDDLGAVGFNVEFEGATWNASISYDTLARMFSKPRHDAPVSSVRESREQLVSHSKAIARIVAERIRAGAMTAERIVIS